MRRAVKYPGGIMWRGMIMTMLLVVALPLEAKPAAKAKAKPVTIEDRWDILLKAYVKPSGGVEYVALNKDGKADLEMLVLDMGGQDFKAMDDQAKTAAYINFYNAGMMLNVLRHAADAKIDMASDGFKNLQINKIKVPGGNIWNGSYKFKINGAPDVTLDDIEHNLIRGQATKGELASLKVSKLDPRIHAAVNCAAYSCPRVRERAYRAAALNAMLDENMREYLNSDEQFAKASDDKLKANSIVLWYYKDFDDYGKANKLRGAGDYLTKFIQPSTKDADWKQAHLVRNFNDRNTVVLRLSSGFDFHYDWRVNDVRNK